jgi:hypothetical protein
MAESEKPTNPESQYTQPGQVVTPGQPTTSSQGQPFQPEQAASPYDPAQYLGNQETAAASQDEASSVSWTASEFIAHEKDAGWFIKLALAAVLLTGLAFLLTRDKVTAAVILFVCIVLGFYANREPRQLPYRVDAEGVQIGEKWFGYEEFRSFSVLPEGAFSSIVLVPLKRFAPLTSIYYAPEDEDTIIGILSQALPFEERKHDPVDRLMQRIRF